MSYNGHPFDDSIIKTLASVRERINLNKASLIVVDGGVGEGKTTLACHLAEHYQPGWVKDRAMQLLAMGGKEFLKALDTAVRNKDQVIVYDEAGDFNSRGALTQFNQTINRIFETYRQTKVLIILCLPFFADLDTSLFKKNIPRIMINCYGRKKTYGNYKVYSLWRTWYLRDKLKKLIVPTDCYKLVDPNLHGHFKDLQSEERDLIGKISIKGKKRIIQKAYLTEKGLVDLDEIMRRTGYSRPTLYLKLRSEKSEQFGTKKFYNKSIIMTLLEQKTRKN